MKFGWTKIRAIATCAAIGAVSVGSVFVAPEATASPAKIPDGAATFTIMGGNIAFGTLPAGEINQALGHPDQPAQCQDGVDNETGNFHNGLTRIASAPSPAPWFVANPTLPATDGLVDFGVGVANETALTGCIDGADNVELFDRTSLIPDPAPLCGSGAATEGFTVKTPPGCTSVTGDALSIDAALTLQKGSVAFGNGSAVTGQERIQNKAGPGTVAGTAITVPQAGIAFQRGYQMQGTCQPNTTNDSTNLNICFDFYIEFKVLPQGDITGVTNVDGTGSVTGNIRIGINITSSYDSGLINFFGTKTPSAATCASSADIALNMTTGTSGTQTGVIYDDVRQNFKVVQDTLNFPTFVGTSFYSGGTAGAGLAELCSRIGSQIGLPDPNGQIALIMTTQATSNSAGSSAAGTGMGATTDFWRPASVTQVGVNGGALGSPQVADNSINVNEGDVVTIDGSQSYDPAMRALSVNALSRTGGTAAAPPATTSTAGNNVTFVAQDAPAGGATHIYSQESTAALGPGDQTQTGLVNQTIAVQNVAPTANAGPAFLATGGQGFTLKGSSVDPGDVDTPAGRGYCWTRTGGGVGPVPPACSGSPVGNGKNLALTAPNVDGSETYTLVVTDKDGAVSAPSQVTVTFRATAPGIISGIAHEDGVPAAGITVDLFRKSTGFIATDTSDGTGLYGFAGLPSATDYIVLFSKAGDTSEYYNRASNSGTATKISTATGGKSIIDGFLVTNANTGTLATNVQDSAGAVAGTSVRVYDETGFVRAGVTDGSGNASFTQLPPKSTYRVRAGLGDATHAELWAVTGGNTAGTAGTGSWTGNEAGKFTVVGGGTTNVNAYLYLNSVAANALGNVTGTADGPNGAINGVEVRLYDGTTGAFVAKAVTGKTIAARTIVNGTPGTFSFDPNQTLYGSGTVLDASEPFDMNGLRPGTYKVWFRNPSGIVSGANPVCSTWANGGIASFVLGNQFQGSGKLVAPLTVTSGGTLAFGTVTMTTAPGCS